MIKLVALDLDGTLLGEKGVLSDAVAGAVARARESGMRVVVCTGRSLRDTRHLLKALSLDGEAILSGGAYIYHAACDAVVRRSPICYETGLALARMMRENRFFNIIFAGADFYVDELSIGLNSNSRYWRERMGKDGIVAANDEYIEQNRLLIDKMMVIGTPSDCMRAKTLASQAFAELEIVSSWENNIEINAKGANKGDALAYVAGIYGIKSEEVAAVGDSLNDAAMLCYAGMPIVMGNAADEIKKLGRFVAPPNYRDGAVWALNEIIRMNGTEQL